WRNPGAYDLRARSEAEIAVSLDLVIVASVRTDRVIDEDVAGFRRAVAGSGDRDGIQADERSGRCLGAIDVPSDKPLLRRGRPLERHRGAGALGGEGGQVERRVIIVP